MCFFASMFETLRKYGSVLMLVLMGLVMVCLVADEYGDAQQLVTQTASSSCMAVIADDFDFDDDDDDEVVTHDYVEDIWASIPTLETTSPKTEGSKCSQALLRGQVRRYSPRNNLPYSPKYILLKNIESGVDLFHATFFVPNTSLFLHNPGRGLRQLGSRSIFQTLSS